PTSTGPVRTATATSASSRATWARWCSRSCSRRPNSVSALAATPPSSARPPPDPQADLTRNSHPHVHTLSALKGYIMAFKGMNPEEGREVATGITEAGQQILEANDQVTAQVNGVNWVGPDYDAYQQDWNSFVSSQVSSLVDAFQAKIGRAHQHAGQQAVTSNSPCAHAHPAQQPPPSTTHHRRPAAGWARRQIA